MIRHEGYFEDENGLRQGIQKNFHSNGSFAYEVNYIDNLLDGHMKYYWSDGECWHDSFFEIGVPEGEHIEYDCYERVYKFS